MNQWLEYAAVWLILKGLGALPRGVARGVAASVAGAMYALLPKLQRTAEFNLRLAFPEWDDTRRKTVILAMVRNLGWMAAFAVVFFLEKNWRQGVALSRVVGAACVVLGLAVIAEPSVLHLGGGPMV